MGQVVGVDSGDHPSDCRGLWVEARRPTAHAQTTSPLRADRSWPGQPPRQSTEGHTRGTTSPTRSHLTVDEIADFVVFLLSERSGVVTGSIIDWDQAVVGGSD